MLLVTADQLATYNWSYTYDSSNARENTDDFIALVLGHYRR